MIIISYNNFLLIERTKSVICCIVKIKKDFVFCIVVDNIKWNVFKLKINS